MSTVTRVGYHCRDEDEANKMGGSPPRRSRKVMVVSAWLAEVQGGEEKSEGSRVRYGLDVQRGFTRLQWGLRAQPLARRPGHHKHSRFSRLTVGWGVVQAPDLSHFYGIVLELQSSVAASASPDDHRRSSATSRRSHWYKNGG